MRVHHKNGNFHKKVENSLAAPLLPIGCSRSVAESLPDAIDRIVENAGPERIVLFGSYAYGNPTADSDVDLLVIMQTDATSAERSWAISKLLLPRPFPVDILVRTPDEVRQSLLKGDPFLTKVLEDGLVLYERSG